MTRNRKIIRNCKKIQKIKKIKLWLLFKQKLEGNGREREKKYKLAFRFVPTQGGLENSKQVAKKFKAL